jgi:hypothetical protein
MDYEDWRRSGLDWFAFHSGVWAGPAGSPDRAERWFRRNLRGLYSVYRMAKARQRREAALARWEREIPSRVVRYTLEAHAAATAAGVGFLAVLVPFKPEGDPPTFDDATYDAFAARLRESGVPTLDLRPIFAAHRDPRSLFYRMDSHWNPDGMRLAADAIAAAILAAPGD